MSILVKSRICARACSFFISIKAILGRKRSDYDEMFMPDLVGINWMKWTDRSHMAWCNARIQPLPLALIPNNIAPSSVLISTLSFILLLRTAYSTRLGYHRSSVSQRSRYTKRCGAFLSLRQPSILFKIFTELGHTASWSSDQTFTSSHGGQRLLFF